MQHIHDNRVVFHMLFIRQGLISYRMQVTHVGIPHLEFLLRLLIFRV